MAFPLSPPIEWLTSHRRFSLLAVCSWLTLALPSCQDNKTAHPIRVEGTVANLPAGKVYLTDAYQWKRVVDSALVTNGHFAFELAADTAFVPFLASIHFPDSTQKDWHYIQRLVYRNAAESKDEVVSGTDAFFLGPEGAQITGQLTAPPAWLTVAAGPDNALFQELRGKAFGYITTRDPCQRPSRLLYFKSLIQQHPGSYFLLKGIVQDKESYSKQELADLLALFDSQLQASSVGRDLRTYFVTRKEASAPYHDLALADTGQVRRSILNPKAKLNLLVFWASWCGPCRKEIPALKQLYRAFHGKGLHMTSISIDEDQGRWRKALSEEQMGWPQVIMAQDQRRQIEQQFSLRAIPVLVLTDSLGNELTQKIGYSEAEMAALQQTIAAGLQ
jgi:thiol-disulfide isomerase/thioredoxin